jgi:hypothetical protein
MIRIAYLNYWSDPINRNHHYFTRFIQANIGPVQTVLPSEYPDLLIASCFGDIDLVQRTRARKKIFYYGENLERYPPYNDDHLLRETFDLIVGFKSTNGHLRFPLWLMYYPYYKYAENDNIITYIQQQYDENVNSHKDIFATCVARHDRGGVRGAICAEFEKHGQVICPGAFRNNVPMIGPSVDDKISYISRSIFNICPENSVYEGYCTEKIFQALEAGTIPVYWGVDLPEIGLICTNKYCQPGDIGYAVSHMSEYTSGPVFTESGGDILARFYDDLQHKIIECISSESPRPLAQK